MSKHLNLKINLLCINYGKSTLGISGGKLGLSKGSTWELWSKRDNKPCNLCCKNFEFLLTGGWYALFHLSEPWQIKAGLNIISKCTEICIYAVQTRAKLECFKVGWWKLEVSKLGSCKLEIREMLNNKNFNIILRNNYWNMFMCHKSNNKYWSTCVLRKVKWLEILLILLKFHFIRFA